MAVCLVLTAVGRASAAPTDGGRSPVGAVRVDFDAPETCATADAFYAAIRSRTALFEPTRAPSETGFDVSIHDKGETFVGTLVVHSPGSTSERRELRTHSCEEILETFALIIAVAVDPNARLNPSPAPVVPPKSEPQPAVVAAAPPKGVPVPNQAPPLPRPINDTSRTAWSAHGAVGVTGGVSLYSAPFAELGVGASLERPGALGYDVRLSIAHTLPIKVIDERDRQVSYALTTARPELGLNLASLSGKLVLVTSLGADLGAVSLDATQTTGGTKSSRPWVALLATSTLRWVATSVVGAELQFGGEVPLVRDQYRLVDPVAYVEKPSPFGGFMTFGLTVRIW